MKPSVLDQRGALPILWRLTSACAWSSAVLQQMIEPNEIANLAAYVASPLSSATNGPA